MLTRLVVENLRCHARTELVLNTDSRLTVLVGPNGSGKTSLLRALAPLRTAGHRAWDRTFAQDLWTHRRQGSESLAFSVDSTEGALREGVTLKGFTVGDGFSEWSLTAASGPEEHETRPGVSEANWPPWLRALRARVTGRYFHLERSALVSPTEIAATTPRFESGGQGLADTLQYLASNEPEAYQRVQSWLRAIVPGVRRVRTARESKVLTRTHVMNVDGQTATFDRKETVPAASLLFDTTSANGLSGSAMSEGTLYALGIATALATAGNERLLLLDALGQGLHPQAQWELVAVLRKALEAAPDLQIVAATHSRDLVDRLTADEVRVMALRPDGTAALRPLTEMPDGERALEVLFPGEAWAALDEDWVWKDEPPAEMAEDDG